MLTALPASAQFATNANTGMLGARDGRSVAADFDNDGNLDVFFSGEGSGALYSFIWRNQGNGTFVDLVDFTLGSINSGLAAGDFFNSGSIDAILTAPGGPTTQFWHNLGGGNFTLITNSGLPNARNGFVAVGDFDNDGRLDIMFWGGGTTSSVVQAYRNLGNGTFTNMNSGIRSIGSSSTVAGVFAADFDNDGFMDVLVTNVVWRNLGNGTFTNMGTGITGAGAVGVAAADYDNDGRLDILGVSGLDAVVWRNLGGGNFVNAFALSNVPQYSSMLWGDFSNDGQLDFFITGLSGYDTNANPLFAAQIWQNTLNTSNSPPTSPTNLTSHLIGGSGVLLNWGAATDDHTPASGLNYNIRVGSVPGGLDIVSPMADPATGRRLVVQIGNAQERLFSILTNLTGGTYYWSVQAIDTAFAGGPFATEATFAIPPTISSGAYQSNGQFQVTFNALGGSSYTLQGSTNLTQWDFVANLIPVASDPAQLTDPNAASFAKRYYRLSCP